MATVTVKAPITNDNLLGIDKGGTNASTAAGARTNLDVYSKSEVDNKLLTMTKEYSYSYSINGNGDLSITASNLGISTPSGYKPFALAFYNSGNVNVVTRGILAISTSGNCVWLHNLSSSAQTGTYTMNIAYVKA